MIQGTGSSVGKSLITAGLLRVYYRRGYNVAPFKSQNMALNAYITPEGLEMGRAQVVQAECCGLEPDVLMNPILLKPSSDVGAQVILMGEIYDQMTATLYHEHKPEMKGHIKRAFDTLTARHDFVLIEGAGSPAEINLRENDLVNMGMAEIADCDVLLVADIDKGGVFASIYGTIMLLEPEERARIKGVLINKFRGDVKLLEPGLRMIEERTGVPVLGVIPYERFAIEEEDGLSEHHHRRPDPAAVLNVAVVRIPHLSNHTDFDALELFDDVHLYYTADPSALDAADLILLPGSKNTTEDLGWMQAQGIVSSIDRAREEGRWIMGICGGFQMLGTRLEDPEHLEGIVGTVDGLGYLDVITRFERDKQRTQVEATTLGTRVPANIKGYEIHMGRTVKSEERPFARIHRRFGETVDLEDGAISSDGKVLGTYLHGVFDTLTFTSELLDDIRSDKGLAPRGMPTRTLVERKAAAYDRLADVLEAHVDMKAVDTILGL